MQCKRCNGRGAIWFNEQTYGKCPECIGGVASCCDIDIPNIPDLEPIRVGKANKEKYIVEKELVTGYEIPYDEPNPFIIEIANMIIEGMKL